MNFGLVIPCYNFAAGLPKAFERIAAWRRASAPEARVYFVDDGSSDGTRAALEELARKNEWCEVVALGKNSGKGAAVRAGFTAARAKHELVVFTDCDLHYGLSIITDRVVPALAENDIVILDRSWVSDAKHQAVARRLASGIFKRFVSVLTGVNYRDTQAGLKAFRAKRCSPIFDLLTLNGFAFDVEVLSIALHYRYRIRQIAISFPSDYEFPHASTIRLVRSSLSMLKDLVRVNVNWKRGRYAHPALLKSVDDGVYLITGT